MARRRASRDDYAVSLFPFLSVLACVIGTLTLLLAALTLQRLGGQSLARILLGEQYEAVKAEIASGEAKLDVLEAQLRASDEHAQAEDELGRRLSALGLSLDISLEELTGLTDLLREAARLEQKRNALEGERKKWASRVSAREQELESRREARVHVPIIIDPAGLGREWRPFLFECTAEYIELHRSDGELSYRIPRAEIERSEDFRRALRRVRNIHDAIVIFLIRPDGVTTCNIAWLVAEAARVRKANLPLPGEGELDLSRMQRGS
jgi:hypothetical protein